MAHDHTEALKNKAFSLLDLGNKSSAQAIFEQVCEQDSHDSEARMMLGVISAETGDLNAAEKNLLLALDLDPEYADAYFYLANVQQSRGQFALALANAEKAVQQDPDFHDAQKLLISLRNLLATPDSTKVNNLKPLQQQLPADFQEILIKADSLLRENKLDEAVSCFQIVIKSYPELPNVWFLLGRTRVQQGDFSDAERCCLEAIRLDKNLVEAQMVLAMSLMMQGKFDDASIACDRALQLQPDNINAIAMAANVAKHMNDPEKSYSLLSPLLKKGVQQINVALAFAMISKDVNKQQQAISLLEKILSSDSSLASSAISNLHFKLGDLYDDINQYDKAFSHYKQGNALKQQSFDQEQFAQYIDRFITTHNSESMAKWSRTENTSDRPVFIVGMVRSGTSLLEQILASHPDVYGAGELGDIYQFSKELPEITGNNNSYPECLSELTSENVGYLAQRYLDHLTQLSPDAKRVIDKLPGNFIHLGLIEMLFPNARIIHCKRDPVDTCLSTYFQDFSTVHSYAYDLSNIAAFYRGYLKLMEHWRKVIHLPLLEINYEDLIANQEDVSRSLVEFCGLEWDENCLQFHKTRRLIRTASYDQVNRPLYKQSVARWKNYVKYLNVLLMPGALLGEVEKIDDAIVDVEKSVKINKMNDASFLTLACLNERKGEDLKAIDFCRNALSLNNENKEANDLFVRLCKKQGDKMLKSSLFDKAEYFFKTALIYSENDASLLYKLALVARSNGKIKESIKFSEEVIDIDPEHIRAKAHIASSYELMGDVEKGNQLIEDLISEHSEHPLVNIVYAQYALRNKRQEVGISALLKMVNRSDIQRPDLISIKMLLGSLYDSIKQYDSAFKYYKQANELKHESYDPLLYDKYITRLINYFSKEKYPSITSSECSTNELIFIIGMPRSGTSLIEQIISSHSGVFGAGELTHVYHLVDTMQADEFSSAYPESLDEASADIMNGLAEKLLKKIREENIEGGEGGEGGEGVKIIDKMPNNFHHIGFIHKLFPNAKFINCIRDARDTCLSCYFQDFVGYHPYASDLNALGIHYQAYERLMKHWVNELKLPVLTVSYENVVSNTRGEVELILDFLELGWEEKCMEFYQRKRTSITASYNQVNKKIYSGSVGRWKNYESHLRPLLDVLNN